jgi:hypothetical protein
LEQLEVVDVQLCHCWNLEGEEEEAFFRTAHQAVQPNEDENRSPNNNASSEAPRLQGGYKMLPAQVEQHLCSQKGKIS